MRRRTNAHLQDQVLRSFELRAFGKLASEMLNLSDAAIGAAMANGTITEVMSDGEAL
jgi:hypothetical protein